MVMTLPHAGNRVTKRVVILCLLACGVVEEKKYLGKWHFVRITARMFCF